MTDAPRTVLFDIGGVIVDLASIRAGYAEFVGELAATHGLDDDAFERWKSTLGDHFRGREGDRYRLARVGYRKATASLFDGDPPEGWESELEAAVEAALRPEDGALGTIEALSEAGVGLAVVSDIDTPEAERMLGALGVRSRFEHVTTSEAIGFTKPDERMFRDALAAMDADPSEALMIGDRYDHDVVGAAALGIETVGYGPDAHGPETDHEIDGLREVLGIVGVDH